MSKGKSYYARLLGCAKEVGFLARLPDDIATPIGTGTPPKPMDELGRVPGKQRMKRDKAQRKLNAKRAAIARHKNKSSKRG